MCIRIINNQGEISYNMTRPLDEQIRGSKQVIIDYKPEDPSVDKFLDEVERLCKHGVSASLNIRFNHNDNLAGARIKKKMGGLEVDLDINELIKLMATAHKETDKKLEELVNYCMGEDNRVKSKT